MQLRNYSFLAGALLLSTLSASAQITMGQSYWVPAPATQSTSQTPSHSYTSVDAYGNVTRTTVQTPLAGATSVPGLIANQAVLGANSTTTSSFSYGNAYGNRGRDRDDRYCPPAYYPQGYYPPAYYPPAYPAYPYPYPYPAVSNNYYYPATPYTVPVKERDFNWSHVPTVTVAPTSTYYGGNYPAPPAYPYYPAYPTPYPYGNYGYPYGTTTTIIGSDRGGIYSQSQSSGYGLSVGTGGVSAQVSNNRSSSSTVVTTR